MTTNMHRYYELKVLTSKTKVTEKFLKRISRIERIPGMKVKRVYKDNRKKRIAAHAQLRSMGINATTALAHSTQANGLSERINRRLLEKFRAMLKTTKLTAGYWGEAVLYAAYLHNLTMTEVLGNKTAYEVHLGIRTNNSNIRIFGSTEFMPTRKQQRNRNVRIGHWQSVRGGEKWPLSGVYQTHQRNNRDASCFF